MTHPNADIVRGAFHALHARDLDSVARLLHPMHVLQGTDSLPWGGVEGFRTFVRRLNHHVEWTAEVEALVENGPEFIVCGRSRGRARATGRTFDVPFVHIYELAGGKIVRSQAMVEERGMLGALPRPATTVASAPSDARA